MRKPKLFYGWWIVAAAFIIQLFAGGVVFYGFTAVFQPLRDEFGWSYTQISFAASLRGMEETISAPLWGFLADRLGPKRLLFGGSVLAALGLLLLSRTNSLVMFYLSFVLLAVGIGACSITVLMTAVANWFRKNLGLATGIVMCGYGFGGLMVPVVVKLMDALGWRLAIVITCLAVLAVIMPLSLLVRHKPEQYGCCPDGEANEPGAANSKLTSASPVEFEVT